jgi:transcriptional regulator with XRE-family HTH domain
MSIEIVASGTLVKPLTSDAANVSNMEAVGGGLKDRIQQVLDANSISASELSRRAGLARTHVRLLMTSKANPTISTIEKIARAAEVSPRWLMWGDVSEAPSLAGGVRAGVEPTPSPGSDALADKPLPPTPPLVDQVEDLLLMAFEKGFHKARHLRAAKEFMLRAAPLSNGGYTLDFARNLLDAALLVDERGEPLVMGALFAEVTSGRVVHVRDADGRLKDSIGITGSGALVDREGTKLKLPSAVRSKSTSRR